MTWLTFGAELDYILKFFGLCLGTSVFGRLKAVVQRFKLPIK